MQRTQSNQSSGCSSCRRSWPKTQRKLPKWRQARTREGCRFLSPAGLIVGDSIPAESKLVFPSSCAQVGYNRSWLMEPPVAAIILAAGLGTRMRSQRAKVLHELGGEPILALTLRAVAATQPHPLIIVVGHQAAEVEAVGRRALPNYELLAAHQYHQLGTGDAARAG